mmetsp:Transcript_18113/g.32194  ORF Transcript_18113/g.32194 Transcript_18113/m.32194 type:complete len:200 (+) Transcript_18113:95-694(+)
MPSRGPWPQSVAQTRIWSVALVTGGCSQLKRGGGTTTSDLSTASGRGGRAKLYFLTPSEADILPDAHRGGAFNLCGQTSGSAYHTTQYLQQYTPLCSWLYQSQGGGEASCSRGPREGTLPLFESHGCSYCGLLGEFLSQNYPKKNMMHVLLPFSVVLLDSEIGSIISVLLLCRTLSYTMEQNQPNAPLISDIDKSSECA